MLYAEFAGCFVAGFFTCVLLLVIEMLPKGQYRREIAAIRRAERAYQPRRPTA